MTTAFGPVRDVVVLRLSPECNTCSLERSLSNQAKRQTRSRRVNALKAVSFDIPSAVICMLFAPALAQKPWAHYCCEISPFIDRTILTPPAIAHFTTKL